MNMTKTLRADIVRALLKKTFADRYAALNARRTALLNKILNAQIPEGFAEVAATLPENWFVKVNSVNLVFERSDGSVQDARMPASGCFYPVEAVRVPACVASHPAVKLWINEKDVNYADAAYLVRDYGMLKSEENEAKKGLDAILNACTTLNKFKKLAPELAALLPEFFTVPAKKAEALPAPDVGTVVQQLMRAGLKLD